MLSDLWLHLKEHIISLIAKLWVNFCGAAMSTLLSVILKGFYFQLWPEKDLFARFKIGHLLDFFPSEVSKTPSAHKSRQQDSLQAERTCHKRAGTNWSPHTASRWAAVAITYCTVVQFVQFWENSLGIHCNFFFTPVCVVVTERDEKRVTTLRTISSEPSHITEENEGSEVGKKEH